MELLIARVAYAFGSLIIPFAAIYISTRKTKSNGIRYCSVFSFAVAWLLQTIVVLIVGESANITIPSAFVLSAIAVFHVAIIAPTFQKGRETHRVLADRKSWWAFYMRLLVLYVPASIIFGALFGVLAEALSLGAHAAIAGAIGQIPASIYASYFAYSWLCASHES